MDGFTISENSMGFTAVRLHYTCDPEKNPEATDPLVAEKAREWLNAQRMIWPDPNDFAREYEINFFTGRGHRVFPQFTETLHVQPLSVNRRKVVYRSWDFGWHAPVCLVSQVDKADRLVILREIIGFETSTRAFAEKVIKECADTYPLHAAGFEDFCDPAGQQVKTIESEKSERRDIEILNGMGIYPRYEYGWSKKDGRTLVHQLLRPRTDGTPGVYVDAAGCPLLVQSFLGRYVYPEQKDGTVKDDPDDDTHPWADLMAALRYLVTGLSSRLALRRVAMSTLMNPTSPVNYTGYGLVKRG